MTAEPENDPNKADDRSAYEADLGGFGVRSAGDVEAGRDELEHYASEMARRFRAGETTAGSAELASGGDQAIAARLRELGPVIEALEHWKLLKDAECATSSFPEDIPKRLGDCRLIREIGRGGNGVVFEAIQGVTHFRRVAVKVFLRRGGSEALPSKQFFEEAATLSRMQHRHIVRIYSFAAEAGYFHYVMRLAEGGSIDRVIQSLGNREERHTAAPQVVGGELTRKSWRAFAQIGHQVAEALAYAHERRVLHGDVKPANLLLDASGNVLVTDFGPSRRQSSEATQLAGTYRYMAPERFDGRCDERSDVYSLGATLYELATLRPAFEGSDRETVSKHVLRHDIVAAKLVQPEVPADFDAIISKAMSLDPGKRYPSAAAMGVDLACFLKGQPLPTPERRRGLAGTWRRIFQRRV